jgi:hypothetical protein
MAIEQENFSLYTYVDDNGVSWNKRGEKEAVRQAVDGSSAAGAHPGWGRTSTRHSPRTITYVDGTTFRTKRVVFYTAAAYAAITLGTSTLTFTIPGSATGVVYTADKKTAERSAKASAGPNLAEHA